MTEKKLMDMELHQVIKLEDSKFQEETYYSVHVQRVVGGWNYIYGSNYDSDSNVITFVPEKR